LRGVPSLLHLPLPESSENQNGLGGSTNARIWIHPTHRNRPTLRIRLQGSVIYRGLALGWE
jgi:hypothetical protein